MDSQSPALMRSAVERAAVTIAPYVRRTPVLRARHHRFGDVEVVFKLEFLQHSGTFKGRGATNFMVTQPIGPAGVVAASGGNHGAAVAWAAREQGHAANIFVPEIAAPAKVDRLRSYGASVHQVGAVYAESLAEAEAFASSSGAVSIHAYNDPVVMAGAGTVAAEMLDDVPDLGAILVAAGGGGLSGGIAAYVGPDLPLVVCETNDTATFGRAVDAGTPTAGPVGGVAADSLGATTLGDNPWSVLSRANARSVLVSDEATLEARSWMWDEFRVALEPAAAVPVAALLADPGLLSSGQPIGIVLCGANVSIRF